MMAYDVIWQKCMLAEYLLDSQQKFYQQYYNITVKR